MKKKQPKPVLAWAYVDPDGAICPFASGDRSCFYARKGWTVCRVEIRVVPSKRKQRKEKP